MDNSEFEHLVDNELQQLADAIEDADEDGNLDVDYFDGVLNIHTDDGKQYVINRHGVTQQIWLSSPYSGTCYYSYMEENDIWEDSDGLLLHEFLADELKQYLNLHITL